MQIPKFIPALVLATYVFFSCEKEQIHVPPVEQILPEYKTDAIRIYKNYEFPVNIGDGFDTSKLQGMPSPMAKFDSLTSYWETKIGSISWSGIIESEEDFYRMTRFNINENGNFTIPFLYDSISMEALSGFNFDSNTLTCISGGQTQWGGYTYIFNSKVKLLEDASMLYQTNPEKFRNTYGDMYVHSVIRGYYLQMIQQFRLDSVTEYPMDSIKHAFRALRWNAFRSRNGYPIEQFKHDSTILCSRGVSSTFFIFTNTKICEIDKVSSFFDEHILWNEWAESITWNEDITLSSIMGLELKPY